jgi:hypothetical protein
MPKLESCGLLQLADGGVDPNQEFLGDVLDVFGTADHAADHTHHSAAAPADLLAQGGEVAGADGADEVGLIPLFVFPPWLDCGRPGLRELDWLAEDADRPSYRS